MLLALVSAQRGQSLHLLDINLMTVTADAYNFPTWMTSNSPGKDMII